MASRPPTIKQEQEVPYSPLPEPPRGQSTTAPTDVIDLISSEDEDDLEVQPTRPDKRSRVSNGENGAQATKRKKPGTASDTLPIGFLEPLPRKPLAALALSALPPPPAEISPNSSIQEIDPNSNAIVPSMVPAKGGSKQFWKAGDYEGSPEVGSSRSSVSGLDHVRVHPKFLHSNATSHKWALGALAELLDNSLDEVANGATFVNIDMVQNSKDGSRMLLVEDNGGGMSPDKLRQCMSLGYSAKSKIASTIGQYGNGFKTSTMRLGADVIVFSRSSGKNGARPTQSIGMLSYTFLTSTGKQDIVVPMLDFENENGWKKLKRTNLNDWNTNLEIIVQWSPYSSEADLLEQFSTIKDQGTRIIIYNLWEDDQGDLELDFDSDPHDIQIRGVNRDEKNIEKAKEYPNSKHYLTYRHSLRSYASILYLRLPHVFQMILRGEEIEHHNIVNDMMLKQDVYYRPQLIESAHKDPQMVAAVTIGFVKDAKHHIDVQGFNVYHKNRLIRPFWRVWTAAGSGGRGVIGVLEANFIEPAHDKQDFERTTMLSRLEARLNQMQKNYWSKFSNQIGYGGGGSQSRKKDKDTDTFLTDSSPQRTSQPPPQPPTAPSSPNQTPKSGKFFRVNHTTAKASTSRLNNSKKRLDEEEFESSDDSDPEYTRATASQSKSQTKSRPNLKPTPSPIQRVFLQKRNSPVGIRSSTPSPVGIGSEERVGVNGGTGVNGSRAHGSSAKSPANNDTKGKSKENGSADDSASIIQQLKTENEELQEKITELELKMSQELQMEKDMNKSLTEQLEETQRKLEETSKEQEALIDIFSEERIRRDKDEENLRKKLKDASDTIQGLFEKLGSTRK